MPKSEPIIEGPHCYCCGSEEPEVQEGRTTCCRDFVCIGEPVIVHEIGTPDGGWVGKVETCCAAAAFVVGWQAGLYPYMEGREEAHLTCAHGFCNLGLLALLDNASL